MSRERTRWSARLPIALGFLAIAVLVGGVGAWAVGTQIAGAVIAAGTVKVETDRQVVQHPEGGVVSAILARDGDHVAAGDLLVRLDDTFLRSELEIIDRQLLEIHARQARFEAERDGHETLSIDLPDSFAQLDPAWVQGQIEGQVALFQARADALARETEQIGEQQIQVERQVDGLQSQLDAMQTQLALVEEELVGQSSLYRKGLVPVARLSALRRAEAEAKGEAGRLQAAIGEAGARIAALDIEKLKLANQRREDAITQLRDLRFGEIELAERRLVALEKLARMEVRAPVGGTVFGSVVLAERSVVKPAEAMMYIVPTDRPIQVLARIDPVHIDQVYPGQTASLRFTAFEQRTTPVFEGTVRRLSADALRDPQTGASFYEAVVELSDPAEPQRGGLAILPGMPVEVFLRTADRTPMSYLVKPFTDYFMRAMREG
ncbi:HlyD family type I secretion periplasmic adaptor subunit [Albidovulum sediminicola]|uniref:Membrane fusion protein (MFP) family protein n=1 Tax=Albidovulum sediminicola TaxID=2984331 RepID=A0ABT2Z5I0_9RHOB|nr:HlyD family type I secretion periplasmic adaptor subunit [Defluviimonas sp. WL0075]MCV2866412.1 HlyD family type I secretion periplasmic adaptor subunit [Defluviimonas sp. WL0075]